MQKEKSTEQGTTNAFLGKEASIFRKKNGQTEKENIGKCRQSLTTARLLEMLILHFVWVSVQIKRSDRKKESRSCFEISKNRSFCVDKQKIL